MTQKKPVSVKAQLVELCDSSINKLAVAMRPQVVAPTAATLSGSANSLPGSIPITKLDMDGNPLPPTSKNAAANRIDSGPYTGLIVARLASPHGNCASCRDWAKNLSHMGQKDWIGIGRLEALFNIWDKDKSNPAYDPTLWDFIPTNDWIWTRDDYKALSGDSGYAWYVDFSTGNSNYYPRNSVGYGLAVRGLPRQ